MANWDGIAAFQRKKDRKIAEKQAAGVEGALRALLFAQQRTNELLEALLEQGAERD